MRMIRLVLLLLVCSFLSLTCSGEKDQNQTITENQKKSGEKKIRIGLSFDSLLIERWQKDRDIFVSEAGRLGAECIFLSADGDSRKQNEQCEILLGQDIDVLVIIPKSATAAGRAVQKAKRQGVPVLAYDRLILNCDLDLYISFDNVRVGRMQAEYLVDQKKGKYFLLGGAPDDNNARLLRQGQMEVLQPFVDQGEVNIIGDNWADGWSPKKAREIIENFLVNVGTDLDAVLASNDGTAGGVIQALKSQGLEGEILVTGQDADLMACRRILDGSQSMTVYKPLRKLATQAAQIAIKMSRGEVVQTTQTTNNGEKEVPSVLLDPVKLDKSNLVEVLTRDQYYPREALSK